MSIDFSGPILVVDDDDGFRAYVAGVLESAGYRAREVAKGSDVLAEAADERPSAVLLDIQLPGLNGYEICRRLRDLYSDSIAIVFLSGSESDDTLAWASVRDRHPSSDGDGAGRAAW